MGYGIRACACTSAGRIRRNNEDSFVLNRVLCEPPEESPEQSVQAQGKGLQWYAVFDGMGGEAYGERASFAAAQVLHREGTRLRFGQVKENLEALAGRMNSAVCKEIGMDVGGCTMAVALIRGHRLYTAHAGDSRLYLFREDSLLRLTRDHTVVRKDRGREHRSHMLLRYLGGSWSDGELCEVSGEAQLLKAGDRILVCSDGLTDMVSDGGILKRLREEMDTQACAQALVKDALDAGGRDNVTVVLADVME